ncbi:DUF421 domain-containing protein [Salipaludibacillus aurantiacus]|uniref:Uncharacterized membrane protein YcaP, DUF421 family n=1 Tax=Salipaludibacillus aurantiacus TaxID=1601833 RepID=A0A1H9VWV1_9BACI|nr:DUF421 domain-containing protein [Salipaludibacillus aurantiacus]SES26280.1 Uncharacterized membrane protein YcaP, DUF421 family [Salipaludibacillus aurantiacus]
MTEMQEIILRTGLAYAAFLVVARFLGTQTLSQMTLHDFIAAVTLGGITANLAFNTKISSINILISLVLFGIIALLITLASLKSRKARYWLSGHPTVLIQDGTIMDNNMNKAKYTLDSLNQAMREKDVFNIDEVEYAVLEPDGHLSLLKKPPFRPVTKQDLNIPANSKEFFPVELIMDGKIIHKNIKENNLSYSWLTEEINKHECTVEDVFYAIRGTNGQLFFDFYKDRINSPVDKE